MFRTCIAIVVWLASGLAVADHHPAPALAEYAWGFPLELESEASLYAVDLPLAVYQSVSDTRLRDLGVYNGAGQPVPRLLRPPRRDSLAQSGSRALPILKLKEPARTSADEVRLRFERQGDRTTLQFDGADIDDTSTPTLSAYIVDARELKSGLDQLTLNWNEMDSGFIGTLTVEGSNDLEQWRRLSEGAIADLREGDTRIEQRTVDLPGSRSDFLRLTWTGLPPSWRLTGVEGRWREAAPQPPRQRVTVKGVADDQDFLFDLAGAPPVDRVRIVLPQPNTVIHATLLYWSDTDQAWSALGSKPIYRLDQGGREVSSPALRFEPVRSSRYRLRVQRGQVGAALQLEASWRTETLLFLAQGSAPFVLASGRAADASEGFPQQRLYSEPKLKDLAFDVSPSSATPGPRFALGGETDLKPAWSLNWRTLALWAGLLAGVAFVAFIAVRVARST